MIADTQSSGAAEILEAIDNADEFVDLLTRLVDATKANPGAPFEPEAISALTELRRNDPPAYEKLRAQLKRAGCRVTELDAALRGAGPKHGSREAQADVLVEHAGSAELFHSTDEVAFADIEINGHRETWRIRSTPFRRWLLRQYYEATSSAPGAEAIQSAINVLEARAHYDGPERQVFLRVAAAAGKLYVDLADEKWRAVEIAADGWAVIERPLVRFRRTKGMRALPTPARGGSVERLRSFLNVECDNDFVLVVGWLLAALRDRGPYPVLVLAGEQGSAKSTFTSLLRAIVDPNVAPLRALPRDDRDLFIAANNSHVQAFDNVSCLPAWLSDTLCRLATGGAFATRALFTDDDEALFAAVRPVILNGIEDIVARADLADRALFLTLAPIPEERRRPEAELWAAFNAEGGAILGALLDAIAEGLERLPQVRLEKLPRLADFATWATACEPTLWPAGTFMAAYDGNREDAVDDVIESDPVASCVRTLMSTRPAWSGTASDLLGELADIAGDGVAKSKAWPNAPRALGGRLRRAATALRKIGIEVSHDRKGHRRTRLIEITTTTSSSGTDKGGIGPSAPSASSALDENPAETMAILVDGMRTVSGPADANGSEPCGTVRAKSLIPNGMTDADGADAKSRTLTAGAERDRHVWRRTL